MTRLLTRNIATMTELRDPQKVLDAAPLDGSRRRPHTAGP